MYFSNIESTRRFVVNATGEIVGVYDQCRSYTLYAPVGTANGARLCFVGEPRSYWPDELTEL